MKSNVLRTTLLLVSGTLFAALLLTLWLMSRQAATLKETTAALQQAQKAREATSEQLATTTEKWDRSKKEFRALLGDLETTRAKVQILQVQMERQMQSQPAKASVALLHRAKRGFNDIQHHVAKGEFAGLALTDGYTELKEIFDNPQFEEFLASDHTSLSTN